MASRLAGQSWVAQRIRYFSASSLSPMYRETIREAGRLESSWDTLVRYALPVRDLSTIAFRGDAVRLGPPKRTVRRPQHPAQVAGVWIQTPVNRQTVDDFAKQRARAPQYRLSWPFPPRQDAVPGPL